MSTLGLFVSGGRLIAQESCVDGRRLLSSSMLLLAICLSIILMVFLWVFSFQDFEVFADGKGHILRLIVPLFLALPLQFLLENSLKGSNKIYDLVILRVVPGILYLSIAYWMYVNKTLNLTLALYLYFGAILLVAIIIILRQGLVLSGISNSVKNIVNEVKTYGFHVYVGTVASVGTTLLGSVALAFFIDTVAMGYFVLARTIAGPLVQIAENIGTAFFRSFSGAERIPKKVFYLTISISLVTLMIFSSVVDIFVDFVYPEKFKGIVPLIYIISIGSVAHGIGGFVNNFLCANGHGKKTRNAAFVHGFLNCFGFTVLVYYFGLTGAAFTVVLAASGFLITILIYYKQITKK
jgi:O-antigen/teichoic acid export membrane protein